MTEVHSHRSRPRHALRKAVAFVVYNLVATLVIVESCFLLMLHAPGVTARTPRPFRRLIQQVYRHFNRSLIQFDRRCARYDPGVAYTLRPGSCTFANLEFRNDYRINHAGLRDNEAALDAPEVIVVGDSHVMGWGVEQEEAMPQVLARKTGRKVLNAGVSSYGTVREMLILDRLDTSRLRTLIVQYSDNDLGENRAFERAGQLPIMSETQYQNIVRYYASQRSYYPGKYLYRLLMKVLRLEAPEPDQTRMDPVSPTEEAELFVNAITRATHVRLDDVRIIVFEINEQVGGARPFVAALELVKGRERYPPFIRRLKTVDVAPLLSADDFYVLDDHMNRRGHEVVAGALADALGIKN